jgi:hypothetical protein
MAVIQDPITSTLVDVDPVAFGVHSCQRVREVLGAYVVGAMTGILAAATASGSPIFIIRNGPVDNKLKVHITNIRVTVWIVTAPTVASNTLGFDVAKFFGPTAISGGTALTARTISKRPYGKGGQSVCAEGGANSGAIRVATTATLTNTGAIYQYAIPIITTPTTLTAPLPGASYFADIKAHGDLEYPIYLAPGQGLAVRLTAAIPTTMTMVAGVTMDWYEE